MKATTSPIDDLVGAAMAPPPRIVPAGKVLRLQAQPTRRRINLSLRYEPSRTVLTPWALRQASKAQLQPRRQHIRLPL
jgi:hypothetical protein